MNLIIIAALNKKRVIGRGGKIPWHIPEDIQRFKELTMGHTVLMGRKTYESIGNHLPGRRNVVITSQNLSGVEQYHSVGDALASLVSEEKVFVIGGGEIYRQTIDKADELILTIVENDEEGDVSFPDYTDAFQITKEEKYSGFSFLTFSKI
jgi:dihydrofolate reductase